ncbi:MAG TPA: hypothetical protein HA298_04370 [Methanobacteriales archaeon]|nr:hypothetical protein [Methanobacteriales archaeon]
MNFIYYWIGILGRFSSNDPRDAFFDFIAKKLSGAFKLQQRRGEFIGLLRVFKENNPSCVMEIYTAEGGSLFCFCKLARNNAKNSQLPFLAWRTI